MSKFKWLGAAAWSAKEVRAGDRLPYARLIDGNTVLLRDGSLMMALQVPARQELAALGLQQLRGMRTGA